MSADGARSQNAPHAWYDNIKVNLAYNVVATSLTFTVRLLTVS